MDFLDNPHDRIVCHQPWYWVVTLDNGQVIYQDDSNYSNPRPNTWLRLKEHCESNSLFPANIKLVTSHGSFNVPVPKESDGICFFKSAGKFMFHSDTFESYLFGNLIDGKIQVHRFLLPTGQSMREQDRLEADCEVSLIKRRK